MRGKHLLKNNKTERLREGPRNSTWDHCRSFHSSNPGKGIPSLLPRTPEKPFTPWTNSLHPCIREVALKEVLPEPWKLSEGKYSPGWVSRITGLVVEKRETARTTNSKVVPHPLPLGVFLKAQRDTELSEVVTLSWVSMMGGIGRYWGSGPQEVMLKVPCHGRKSSSL